ncbi:hypothetical protein MRB53_040853 [Persea americana]|nr:hypothetical protein MRB53_040853 [Persea americana]
MICWARLRRLEGVVQHLGVKVDDDGDIHHDGTRSMSTAGAPGMDDNTPEPPDRSLSLSPPPSTVGSDGQSLDANFGRLVEALQSILYESSEEEQDTPSPASGPHEDLSHHGFIFGFSSLASSLHQFHPQPQLMEKYLNIYLTHVDPLVRMAHYPTMRAQMLAIRDNNMICTKGEEAMLFAMYFAVVTALSPEVCQRDLEESRALLVSRYRFAFEQALARAHFMVTEELVVLQAFVIFLICLRRHEDARVIWSLVGLVVRVAINLGLHRDGTSFGLPALETEVRRRTWWQICILDVRSSEDHGCDPTIMDIFDTKYPLNVNDEDLVPGSKTFPTPRTGICQMTFCLIRFSVADTFRRLRLPSSVKGGLADKSFQEREQYIADSHRQLEDTYLVHCDMKDVSWPSDRTNVTDTCSHEIGS